MPQPRRFNPSALQFPCKRGFVQKHRLIFSRVFLVWQVVQPVVGLRGAPLSTQDQTKSEIVPGLCPVLTRVIEIGVHLSGVCIAEAAHFQFDDEPTSRSMMKEHQVDIEPDVIDPEASLSTDVADAEFC